MFLTLEFFAFVFLSAGVTALFSPAMHGEQYPLFDRFPFLTFRRYAMLAWILAILTWATLLYFYN